MFSYNMFAHDVINRNIIACEAVCLAIKRHVDDIEKSKNKKYPYYFDDNEAERPITFIQNLSHTKGKWASERQKIKLEPWQQFIVASVFGWRKKSDNLRRFRKAYIQVARKNGRTTMLSGIGNYTFFCDSPPEVGVEIYYIATKKEQAKIAWEEAERQIRKCKALDSLASTYKQNTRIVKKNDTASKALILGKDSKTKDGLNPHFVGVDEYHAHPNNELIEVLESGMGARRQPLIFIITTAGFNKNGVCFEEYNYLKSILNGTIENDEYFFMIFEPDEKDDWTSDNAIIKANPNLNISVSMEFIKSRIKEAMDKPSKQIDVKTKNLNIWTQSASVWIPKEVWDMTQIRQTFSVGGLSEGTALFEKAIYEKKLIHNSNPVLDWMMNCCEVRTDGRDNYLPVKPDRRKNSKRIDGVVSSIMAIHSAVRNSNEGSSVYDTGGVFVL